MNDSVNTDTVEKEKNRDEEILEQAKKELMREVKCASIRAEQLGAHSWAKPQSYVPSKRFLRQMLMNAEQTNKRRDEEHREFLDKDRPKRYSPYRRSYVESKHLNSSKHKNEDRDGRESVSKKKK